MITRVLHQTPTGGCSGQRRSQVIEIIVSVVETVWPESPLRGRGAVDAEAYKAFSDRRSNAVTDEITISRRQRRFGAPIIERSR